MNVCMTQGTVDDTKEKVQWNRVDVNGMEAMRIGSSEQVNNLHTYFIIDWHR